MVTTRDEPPLARPPSSQRVASCRSSACEQTRRLWYYRLCVRPRTFRDLPRNRSNSRRRPRRASHFCRRRCAKCDAPALVPAVVANHADWEGLPSSQVEFEPTRIWKHAKYNVNNNDNNCTNNNRKQRIRHTACMPQKTTEHQHSRPLPSTSKERIPLPSRAGEDHARSQASSMLARAMAGNAPPRIKKHAPATSPFPAPSPPVLVTRRSYNADMVVVAT